MTLAKYDRFDIVHYEPRLSDVSVDLAKLPEPGDLVRMFGSTSSIGTLISIVDDIVLVLWTREPALGDLLVSHAARDLQCEIDKDIIDILKATEE